LNRTPTTITEQLSLLIDF